MQDAIDIKVLQTLGLARDRPSPYGNGKKANIGMARDRPSPYELGEGCAWHGEEQALVLRDSSTARDRPPPYGNGKGANR